MYISYTKWIHDDKTKVMSIEREREWDEESEVNLLTIEADIINSERPQYKIGRNSWNKSNFIYF